MKFNRYVSLLVLFLIGTVALSGCSLFRSDFTTISPDELKIIVDDLPDQQKRILAQNEQSRKELIEQFRRACLLAQASEDEGLHKSDEFKKRTAIDEERLLAGEFSKRNLDFNISTDELNKYLDDNKAAFESDRSSPEIPATRRPKKRRGRRGSSGLRRGFVGQKGVRLGCSRIRSLAPNSSLEEPIFWPTFTPISSRSVTRLARRRRPSTLRPTQLPISISCVLVPRLCWNDSREANRLRRSLMRTTRTVPAAMVGTLTG